MQSKQAPRATLQRHPDSFRCSSEVNGEVVRCCWRIVLSCNCSTRKHGACYGGSVSRRLNVARTPSWQERAKLARFQSFVCGWPVRFVIADRLLQYLSRYEIAELLNVCWRTNVLLRLASRARSRERAWMGWLPGDTVNSKVERSERQNS